MATLGKILVKLIAKKIGSPKFGCEVGVWKGSTSRTLLNRFSGLSLLMIDRWEVYSTGSRGPVSSQAKVQQLVDNAMRIAVQQTEFAKDRRVILVADSARASEFIQDGSLDFVFIDADHSYDAVRKDLSVYYRKVRSGGLFCGHDYETKGRWGVKQAVDEFVKVNGLGLNRPTDRFEIWWSMKK